MRNQAVYRIGGIAVLVSVLLSLGSYAVPALLAFGSLALALFIFALYRLFSPSAALVSLVAGVVGIVGAVALAIISVPAGAPNNSLANLAIWAAWFLSPLAFGLLALRHRRAGMPQPLALIGIVSGIFGLLNLLVTLAVGGNWSQPNNAALSPVILATYYIGTLFGLAWLVWSGIVFLQQK